MICLLILLSISSKIIFGLVLFFHNNFTSISILYLRHYAEEVCIKFDIVCPGTSVWDLIIIIVIKFDSENITAPHVY